MSSTDGTRQPGQRDRERTRAAVLDATERLLSRRGAHVSLAAVADAAGVTKGGLLHRFRSRDDLLAFTEL